jgi:hypothetical protein
MAGTPVCCLVPEQGSGHAIQAQHRPQSMTEGDRGVRAGVDGVQRIARRRA